MHENSINGDSDENGTIPNSDEKREPDSSRDDGLDQSNEQESSSKDGGNIFHLDELPSSVVAAAKSCPECAAILISSGINAAASGSVPAALGAIGSGLGRAGVALATRTAEVQGTKIAKSELGRVFGTGNESHGGSARASEGNGSTVSDADSERQFLLRDIPKRLKDADGGIVALGQEMFVELFGLRDGDIERIVDLINSDKPREVERFIRDFRVSKGDTFSKSLARIVSKVSRRFK